MIFWGGDNYEIYGVETWQIGSGAGTTYNETVAFAASSGLIGTTTRTTAQTATLATQAAITPTATRTAAFTTAFAAAAAVDHVLTVTMAPIVSFATSAGMTASAVLAAAASVTFAAVNALIGVFDGDGSAPGRRRLKRWLSWPPFPWKQWFR